MLSACAHWPLACIALMFWLKTPGIGAGTPGTVGGCVGPVARDTSPMVVGAKVTVRVYCVTTVVLVGPSGFAICLLWPNCPLRAVPENVIEFRVSAPIALDA